MDSVHMQQTTFPGVFRHWELPKCYIVTCIMCTYYTEGKEIFSEIFRHLLLPTYSVLAAKILPGILSSRWCNVCTQCMWKWYILTAVRAEILQVTSFWLRGNMCTQYMYGKVNYLAGCWCWTTSRMIVIPPREYLHSIQVKITYFASSWYEQCMFDLLRHCVTFQEHYLTILQHCLTFRDHSLTFLEHCLTFYEHCLTSWVHHWTFQEHCLTFQEHHFMMFWFHIPDSYEYDWTEITCIARWL